MPDLNRLLKEEIARLARKEVRAEVEQLKKVSAQYRHDIAALKRHVAGLEKELGRLRRKANGHAAADAAEAAGEAAATRHRFSAARLRTMRQRLELSAADFGALVGVSAQTVYNWEGETTRPKPEQLAAIATVRAMGKRALRARLAELSTAAPAP